MLVRTATPLALKDDPLPDFDRVGQSGCVFHLGTVLVELDGGAELLDRPELVHLELEQELELELELELEAVDQIVALLRREQVLGDCGLRASL